MEKTYSIIIPHRNMPKLLQRCLDSIPYREDVQVIIVDDNSDPEMVDFNAFPGAGRKGVEIIYTRESRICMGEDGKGYFTKRGKGPGYARNVALQKAQGKWIVFADADDFFHKDMLQILDAWKDSEYDIIFFDTDSVDSDTLAKVESRQAWARTLPVETVRWVYYVPWGKLIRSELIKRHAIVFDEICGDEDVMFSIYSSLYARKVIWSSKLLYCSVVRSHSLWNSTDYDHLLNRLKVYIRLNKVLCRYKIKFPPLFSLGYVLSLSETPYRWKAWSFYLRHERNMNICKHFVQALRFNIGQKWLVKHV
ncbi:MAG: glycosyltransferase family 2 protein [Prevotellaceae bacterium]|nr:glycosyltransferase family 2 protein [Prevotellaceae bacterium]